MAKSKIKKLREEFVGKFFISQYQEQKYTTAYVTDIKYLRNDYYEARYISIVVDETLQEVLIHKNNHSRLTFFIDNFEKRGNKWAEGFIEKMLDELRLFGKGVIDV